MAQLNSTIINGDLAVAGQINSGKGLVLDKDIVTNGSITASGTLTSAGQLTVSNGGAIINGDVQINYGILKLIDNNGSNEAKIQLGNDIYIYDCDLPNTLCIAGMDDSSKAEVLFGDDSNTGHNKLAYDGNCFSFGSKIEAPSYTATSDARLKENLVVFKPEKSILDLPIYKFDFINGSKNHIGCLAQDLQEICPEIVHEGTDGYLSIEESKIIYLLLDEVKKLKAEVEELKK